MIRSARGRLIATATFVALAVATSACGSDDDAVATTEPTASTTRPAASAPPASVPAGDDEFCTGFLGLDRAFAEAPEDPAQIEAYVAEHVQPNIELIEANPPATAAAEVTVMLDSVAQFLTSGGDYDVFATPEFSAASATVYGSLDELCDVPVVTVDMVDYAFQGLPTEMAAGTIAVVVQNASAAEGHELGFAKIKDGVEMTTQQILALPDDEAEAVIEQFGGGTFAEAGAQSGTTVALTPGRWIAACFLPVAGDEAHTHWQKGMFQELTVT